MKELYYLIFVWGDVSPTILGPFDTIELRDEEAQRLRTEEGDEHGIYSLDINGTIASIEASSYSGTFFKEDQDEEEEEPAKLPVEEYRADIAGIKESHWSTNEMTFPTIDKVKAYLDGLSLRWFGYDMARIVPNSEPTGQEIDMEDPLIYQNFRK